MVTLIVAGGMEVRLLGGTKRFVLVETTTVASSSATLVLVMTTDSTQSLPLAAQPSDGRLSANDPQVGSTACGGAGGRGGGAGGAGGLGVVGGRAMPGLRKKLASGAAPFRDGT